MRICLISPEYPPDTGWGGTGSYIYQLARGLKELGQEVQVISLTLDKEKSLVQDGIRVHRINADFAGDPESIVSHCMPNSKYLLSTSLALWKKFVALDEQYHFDIVDTPELLAGGLFPGITKSTALIVRLHAGIPSAFISNNFHKVAYTFDFQFSAMIRSAAVLLSEGVIAHDREVANNLKWEVNYPQAKVDIINQPIDTAKFSPEGTKHDFGNAEYKVLFAGWHNKTSDLKALKIAIESILSRFNNVQCVIMSDDGNHNGISKEKFFAEMNPADAAKLQDQITFLWEISYPELPSYLRAADICVLPSPLDDYSHFCLRAMSCGKAVIAYDNPAYRQLMTDDQAGILVPEGQPQKLADAITNLLQNPAKVKLLSENARTTVLAKFTRETISKQTLNLYQDALTRFRSRPAYALYRRQPRQVIDDAEFLLSSWEQMLYDLFYTQSLRFRLHHWFKIWQREPNALLKKIKQRLFGARFAANKDMLEEQVAPAQTIESTIQTNSQTASTQLVGSSQTHK